MSPEAASKNMSRSKWSQLPSRISCCWKNQNMRSANGGQLFKTRKKQSILETTSVSAKIQKKTEVQLRESLDSLGLVCPERKVYDQTCKWCAQTGDMNQNNLKILSSDCRHRHVLVVGRRRTVSNEMVDAHTVAELSWKRAADVEQEKKFTCEAFVTRIQKNTESVHAPIVVAHWINESCPRTRAWTLQPSSSRA